MTATAHARRPDTDRATVIRTLLTLRKSNATALASVVRLTSPQLTERFKGEVPFRDHELEAIADHLRVPVAMLYLTPEELERRLSAFGYRHTDLEVIATEGDLQQSLPFPPALTVVG